MFVLWKRKRKTREMIKIRNLELTAISRENSSNWIFSAFLKLSFKHPCSCFSRQMTHAIENVKKHISLQKATKQILRVLVPPDEGQCKSLEYLLVLLDFLGSWTCFVFSFVLSWSYWFILVHCFKKQQRWRVNWQGQTIFGHWHLSWIWTLPCWSDLVHWVIRTLHQLLLPFFFLMRHCWRRVRESYHTFSPTLHWSWWLPSRIVRLLTSSTRSWRRIGYKWVIRIES